MTRIELHPLAAQELHGLPALLQALDHLRSSPAASKAALVQIRNSAPWPVGGVGWGRWVLKRWWFSQEEWT